MNGCVVLDAAGLDQFARQRPSTRFRSLLEVAWERERDVVVPAVVCAEVCRGAARTRAVEAALGRHRRERGQRPAVIVAPTDFALARQVGAILRASKAGTADMVDAHVVAVAASHGGGLVITSDPADITRLSATLPAARITTTRPD